MRLHKLVTFEDGTTAEVKTGPADVLAWEDDHGRSFSSAIEEGKAEWLYWLVWHAFTRRAAETRSFAEWIDEVADMSDAGGDARPPVSTPDRSTGSSRASRSRSRSTRASS